MHDFDVRIPDMPVAQAVEAQPTRGRMWENLGVTQMRLTMLDDAKESFSTARKYDKSMNDDNLKALKVGKLFYNHIIPNSFGPSFTPICRSM